MRVKGMPFCMKASQSLWKQWSAQLRQVLPQIHGHRSKTLAFFVLGVMLAGTTRVPRVAEALLASSPAKTPSIERRLARVLANDRIEVESLGTPLLSQFLHFWGDQRLVFVLDGTSSDERASVIYLGWLVQSRLLPVSWQIMPVHQSWEQSQWTLVGMRLDRVIPHLGAADCTLLADRGLVGCPRVQWCQARGGHCVLRLSSQHTCQPRQGRWAGRGLSCGGLVAQPGQQGFGPALVWHDRRLPASVSAIWDPQQREPWILLSDRPAGRGRGQEYARRLRVESTFEDLKRRGWDLEGTLVSDRARLDRVLLVGFLSLWWLAHLAASGMHHGQRDRFDRRDRRDNGIFRLGRLWLLDLLRNNPRAASLAWCLPFRKKPSGWAFSLRF
jgi:hypothetical protein